MGRLKVPASKKKSIISPVRISPEDKKFMIKFGITTTKLVREGLEIKKEKKK